MTIIHSCVKKISGLSALNCVNAELVYPKIVLFEDKRTVHILDIADLNEIHTNVHSFQSDIVHQIIYNGNLWMALKSGDLYVLNLRKDALIEIKSTSNANYKVRRFSVYDSRLVLLSEGGERLVASFSNKGLQEEFDKNTKEFSVSLVKSPIPVNALDCETRNVNNGFNISIDSGKLLVKCLYTGLTDVIATDPKLQYVSLWNEMVIIAADTKMWALNEKFQLLFEFENISSQYFPLAAHADILYYITWNREEVNYYLMQQSFNF